MMSLDDVAMAVKWAISVIELLTRQEIGMLAAHSCRRGLHHLEMVERQSSLLSNIDVAEND